MFKIIVFKTVWVDIDRQRFKAFRKELSLPFAPSIGIELDLGNWNSGPLKRVRWDGSAQQFVCNSADGEPDEDERLPSTDDDIVEMYSELGWTPVKGNHSV